MAARRSSKPWRKAKAPASGLEYVRDGAVLGKVFRAETRAYYTAKHQTHDSARSRAESFFIAKVMEDARDEFETQGEAKKWVESRIARFYPATK